MHPTEDTLQALIQQQADAVVDEYPDDALKVLATDLEADPADDEGFQTALAVAAELRLRASAGVRKWPGLRD
jgi:hypothetical protein